VGGGGGNRGGGQSKTPNHTRPESWTGKIGQKTNDVVCGVVLKGTVPGFDAGGYSLGSKNVARKPVKPGTDPSN